jgi:hypothetical protein
MRGGEHRAERPGVRIAEQHRSGGARVVEHRDQIVDEVLEGGKLFRRVPVGQAGASAIDDHEA